MDYDFLHHKYGRADVDKPFGTIIFESITPQVSFSCEFTGEISDMIEVMKGPVLVMDVQSLEALAIIDKFIFKEIDETGISDIGISMEEVNDNLVIGKEYVMYLFAGYNYQVDLRKESSGYFGQTTQVVVPNHHDSYDFSKEPIGTVILKDNADSINNPDELRTFPSVCVEAKISFLSAVIIAENHDSELVLIVDFENRAHAEAIKKHKKIFSQTMSDQVAFVIFAMLMAFTDGSAETNKTYNIYPAFCIN